MRASLVSLVLVLASVQATHLRYGQIRWQRIGGWEVRFRVDTAWRFSFINASLTYEIGDTYGFSEDFRYGDGEERRLLPEIALINTFSDWFFGVTEVDYDYGEAATTTREGNTNQYNGPNAWVPYLQRCCRIDELEFNQDNAIFWFGSTIPMTSTDLSSQNVHGPESELPPIVFIGEPDCCEGRNSCEGTAAEIREFHVTGRDLDGDVVSYYLNQQGAFPGGTGSNQADTRYVFRNTNPGTGSPIIPWITVDETSGVVTTRPCGRVGQWTAQILMEDNNVYGNARTALDFLIFVVDESFHPFIVHEIPPWQRESDGGFLFNVNSDPLTGQPLTNVRTPPPGAKLDGNLGDELAFYVYGISTRDTDVLIFFTTPPPPGMTYENDIETDQPRDRSDTMLVRWTPQITDTDSLVCFGIQEIEEPGREIDYFPGINFVCVEIVLGGVPNVLPGILRDFSTHHDDFGFEEALNPSSPAFAKPSTAQTGAVNVQLGSDRKPEWSGGRGPGDDFFTDATNFNSWYRTDDASCSPVSPANDLVGGSRVNPAFECGTNIGLLSACDGLRCCFDQGANIECSYRRGLEPRKNLAKQISLTLSGTINPNPSIFTFRSTNFLPINDDLLGNEGQTNNRDFTLEVNTQFRYTGDPLELTFESSDDLWVFIDGQLVIDFGGVHQRVQQTITIPNVINRPVDVDEIVQYDFFYASRSIGSFLRIDIPADFGCDAITEGAEAFEFNSFNNTLLAAGSTIVPLPSAAAFDIDANRLSLITEPNVGTAVYFGEPLRVAGGFRVEFTYEFANDRPLTGSSANGDPRAHGFTFIVSRTQTRGDGNGGLGYNGIPNSLVVEFDTIRDVSLQDSSNNHVAVHTRYNGGVNSASADQQVIGGVVDLDGSDINLHSGSHRVIINYTPENAANDVPAITVFIDDDFIPVLNDVVLETDLATILGGSGSAFIGFTAGSGEDIEEIFISNWKASVVAPGAGASVARDFPLLVAGVQDSFVIELRDACNRPITVGGQGDLLTVRVVPFGPDNFGNDPVLRPYEGSSEAIVVSSPVDNSDGTYNVFLTMFRAGFYEVTVLLRDEGAASNGLQQVIQGVPTLIEVVAGPPFAPNCFAFNNFATGDDNLEQGEAGNLLTRTPAESFNIRIMDEFLNFIGVGGAIGLTVQGFGPQSFTNDGFAGTGLPVVSELTGGVYVAGYYTTVAGEYQLQIRLDSQDIGDGNNEFDPNYPTSYQSPSLVTIIPGPAYSGTSFISDIPAIRVIAGVEQNFKLRLRDQFENERDPTIAAIGDEAELIEADPSVPSLATVDPPMISVAHENNDDEYTVSFTFYTASTQVASNNANSDVGTYEIAVSLNHPDCDANYALFDCSGLIDVAEIFVFPGEENAATSDAEVPDIMQATVVAEAIIQARDEFENDRFQPNDFGVFTASMRDDNNVDVSDWIIDGPRQEVGVDSGRYFISIVPEIVGPATVTIALDGDLIRGNPNNPYETYIVPGPISSEESEARRDTGPDNVEVGNCVVDNSAVANRFSEFYEFDVTANDNAGNLRDVGTLVRIDEPLDDTESFFLRTEPPLVGEDVNVMNNGNGAYTIRFCSERAGTYAIETITIDGDDNEQGVIINGDFSVTISPGPIDAVESSVRGTGLAGQPLSEVTFFIDAFDRFGNDVNDPDDHGISAEFTLFFGQADDQNGIIDVSVPRVSALGAEPGYTINRVATGQNAHEVKYVVPNLMFGETRMTIDIYLTNIDNVGRGDRDPDLLIHTFPETLVFGGGGVPLPPSNARALPETFLDGVDGRRASVAGDMERFAIQDWDYGDSATNDEADAKMVTRTGDDTGCQYPFLATNAPGDDGDCGLMTRFSQETRDTRNSPLSDGLQVTLQNADDPNLQFPGVDFDDDGTGRYEALYNVTVSGTYRVIVTYLGADIYFPSSRSALKDDLMVVPGAPYPPEFLVDFANNVPAGDEVEIEVQLRDRFRNEITNDILASDTLIEFNRPNGVSFTEAAGDYQERDIEQVDGRYIYTYSPRAIGTHLFQVLYPDTNGEPSGPLDEYQVLVTPGPLSPPHSFAQGTAEDPNGGQDIIAGSSASFTLHPSDEFGNGLGVSNDLFTSQWVVTLSNGNDMVDATIASSRVRAVQDGDINLVSGFYEVFLQELTSAGEWAITATALGDNIGTDPVANIMEPYTLNVVPAPANSITFTTTQATAVAGMSGTFTLNVFDQYGNLRDSSHPNIDDSGLILGTIIDPQDNANDDGIERQCDSASPDPNSQGYILLCTGTIAGDALVFARIANGDRSTNDATLTITPAETFAPNCVLADETDPNPGVAIEADQVSTRIRLQTRDRFGNNQIDATGASDALKIYVYQEAAQCSFGELYTAVPIINSEVVAEASYIANSGGIHEITFQSTLAKSYAYDIVINDLRTDRSQRVDTTVQDLTCPSLLVIAPGELDPEMTEFSQEQFEVTAGVMAQFDVSWFDRFGNQFDEDPVDVQIGVDVNDFGIINGAETTITLPAVDVAGNSYRVIYLATVAGVYPLVVRINCAGTCDGYDEDFADLPINSDKTITILTGPLSPPDTTHPQVTDNGVDNDYWIDPDDEMSIEARATAAFPGIWRIEANDAFGNDIDGTFTVFEFASTAQWQQWDPEYDADRNQSFDARPFFAQAFTPGTLSTAQREVGFISAWEGEYRVDVAVLTCANDMNQFISTCNYTTTNDLNDLHLIQSAGFTGYNLRVLPATCAGFDSTTPYRCEDRTCANTWADCGETSTGTIDGGSCPGGSSFCPNGQYCVANTAQCPPAETCSTEFPAQCRFDNSCRKSNDDCPTAPICPPGMDMCPDGRSCEFEFNDCDGDRTATACDAGFFKCFDGSCAFRRADCPTPISCGPSLILCATDNSCRASRDECPSQYECFEETGTPYRCATGDCRETVDDCPNLISCPFSWVMCPNGKCAEIFAECQEYENCPLDTVRCPDGTCKTNLLHCSTQTTCKQDEVLCPDGGCQNFLSDCGAPIECAPPLYLCSSGDCVSDEDICPTLPACPFTAPVRCSDGSCAGNVAACRDTIHCPVSLPHRCADGSCKALATQCSPSHGCPPSAPFKCFDNSCRADQFACADTTIAQCPLDTVRCPEGECKQSMTLCSTPVSCPSGLRKCADNSCRDSCEACNLFDGTCSAIGIQCPVDQVQCSDLLSCRDSLDQCPTRLQCPPEEPVRCSDHSCAAGADFCLATTVGGRNVECQAGIERACPDGSCLREDSTRQCGPGVTCPAEFPILCYDSSCRASLADCPPIRQCPLDNPFLCQDGACRANKRGCDGVDVTCTQALPVLCWDLTCAASVGECETGRASGTSTPTEFTSCPLSSGAILCADGACVPDATDCEGVVKTCSDSLPVKCADGSCASTATECRASNDCPFNRPIRCENGQCVSSQDQCVASTCPSVTCPDGSCRASEDQCPNANGCDECDDFLTVEYAIEFSGDQCPVKCHTGQCVEESAQCDLIPVCPAVAPVRCFNGLCVQSSAQCPPAVQGELTNGVCTDPDAPIACAAGECVAVDDMCRSVAPCRDVNQVRCNDGSCRGTAAQCPPFTNFCPAGHSHFCLSTSLGEQTFDGYCVATEADCILKDVAARGCTAGLPVPCDGGRCAATAIACLDVPVPNPDGCVGTQRKCSDGSCVADLNNCPALNGCPIDRPLRCANGDCVVAPTGTETTCPAGSECPTGTQRCANGDCEASLSACSAANGCAVTSPYRCGDGSCVADEDSCPAVTTCDSQSWTPYLCANRECVGHESQCQTVSTCSLGVDVTGVLCADFSCAATAGDCPEVIEECPAGSPVRCPDSSCTTAANLCADPEDSECQFFPAVFRCFDGFCVEAPSECVERGEEIWGPDCINVCSDGSCGDASGCEVIDSCPSTRPLRCPDGACQTDSANCAQVDACASGQIRCADGVCRAADLCPSYSGCLDPPYQCPDSTCAANEAACPVIPEGQAASNPWLRYVTCPEREYLVNPSQTTQFDICYAFGGSVVTMSVASGGVTRVADGAALLQTSGSDTSTWGRFRIAPAATSDLTNDQVRNLVHESRQAEFSSLLAFDESVMSAPFTCFADEDMSVELPMTVIAQVDRDMHPTSNDCYLPDGDVENCVTIEQKDICLAHVGRGIWVCNEQDDRNVESNQAIEINADGTLVSAGIPASDAVRCTPEGRTYAFIVQPVRVPEVDNSQDSWLAQNWQWLLLGILIGVFCFSLCVFMLVRALRYRKKYHKTRNEMTIANKELDEIQEQDELGMGHFGQMGPGAHVQVNPLSQAAVGGEDEEILAEKRAMRDEIQRQREDALRARQEIEMQSGNIHMGHTTQMGGHQMARRGV